MLSSIFICLMFQCHSVLIIVTQDKSAFGGRKDTALRCIEVKLKSLFRVPTLAAGGPYWVLISQKVGSLFQSLGVLITFGDSEFLVAEGPYFLIIIRLKFRFLLTRLTGF